MGQRIRLIDIAAACMVSKAAVVQALNRSPETCELRPQTRDRIRAMAAQLGYRPDWRARALAGGRTSTVALLYAGLYPAVGGYSNRLLGGLARRLAERGVGLLLLRCWEHATWREAVDERRIDGAVVLDDPPAGLLATRLPVPLVLLNVAAAGAVPQVLPDDRGGAMLAVRRLVELGHRRIVHLAPGGGSRHFSALARCEGYLAAMAEAGLEPHIIDRPEALPGLHADPARRPSAVLAYEDGMAIAAMRQLQACGLHIPGDLAVIGTNNSPEAASASPTLASIALPEDPLAFAAADLLLDLIAGRAPPDAPILLQEHLVERGSLGPPG